MLRSISRLALPAMEGLNKDATMARCSKNTLLSNLLHAFDELDIWPFVSCSIDPELVTPIGALLRSNSRLALPAMEGIIRMLQWLDGARYHLSNLLYVFDELDIWSYVSCSVDPELVKYWVSHTHWSSAQINSFSRLTLPATEGLIRMLWWLDVARTPS